ncbi:MAG: hypothetical protein U0359_06690 [Byssovorax sp.]
MASQAARAKKAAEQRDALDLVSTFLVDLAGSGLGALALDRDEGAAPFDHLARRMADADLRGVADALRRLSALLSARADRVEGEGSEGAIRGPWEAREAEIAAGVTDLWALVRRGQGALDRSLTGERDERQDEDDAAVASSLGRAFKLDELREAGFWVRDRTLVELASEQRDDPAVERVIATGYLLDLDGGAIVREETALPYQALVSSRMPKAGARFRVSRSGVLTVKEAALYPGNIVNRRIRWEDKVDAMVSERPLLSADVASIHGHARPLAPLLDALRAQLKEPLGPREAVVLLAVARFGVLGERVVAEDRTGARLVLRDPRGASCATTFNLRRAAGAFGAGSLALRLYLDLTERAVYGQALSLIAGDRLLRLGL